MLRLRPLRPGDEAAFRAGHAELAGEGFTFGLEFSPDLPWEQYLRALRDHRVGVNLPAGHVPSTVLAADVSGQLVGRTSIRHELNDFLRRQGGHIGYSVLPAHRRRGYATEILRQSLVIIRSLGIDRVLITCDDDNVGSFKTIEACGGRRDPLLPSVPGSGMRRYWID